MPDLRLALHRPSGRPPTAASPPSGPQAARPAWLPVWSVPAAMRAARAVVVIPSLFALAYEGFRNLQMALFAAFGGFASLIFAAFGGTKRDKLIAHLGLAVTGSIGLIIGTAVSPVKWLAVLVTIPVAFGIFFAGVAGPNAASGVAGALLGYVLPVATPGTISMIPDRLAGWWLASVVSTAAVLLFSPPSPGDRLRAAAAGSARALAAHLEEAVRGTATAAGTERCQAAKHELMNAFASTPYRPTGLATADQGLASVVQLLEWCTALLADATDGHPNLDRADQCDRNLLAQTASVLRQAGDLLAGQAMDDPGTLLDASEMDRQREACGAYHRSAPPNRDYDSVEIIARHAFHAQAISIAVRAIVADTLIATRHADPETIAARRRGWYGAQPEGTMAERRGGGPSRAIGGLARRASVRSVWFLHGLRRVHRAARARRHRDRLRRRRPAAAWHRDQHPGTVGGAAHCPGRGRLRTGHPAVHLRPGGVHRRGGRPVQPASAGRLEGRPAPHPGRGARLPGQPRGRRAVLAAWGCLGGRRRSLRRVPARRRVPNPGGGLGPRLTAHPAGRGRRGGHGRHPARRGAPRLPGRAGCEAAVQRGPVDTGDGHHAAQADRLLAGRPAGAGFRPARPAPGHGLCAGRAGPGHGRPRRLLRADRGAGRAAGRPSGAAADQRPGVRQPGREPR